MAGVNLIQEDPFEDAADVHSTSEGICSHLSSPECIHVARVPSNYLMSEEDKMFEDPESSNVRYNEATINETRLDVVVASSSRQIQTPSASLPQSPQNGQVKASEVVYFTGKLRDWYERSNSELMAISKTRRKKSLDKAKKELEEDPAGIKKMLRSLGKEDLMTLIIKMANKLEELGKSGESKALIDSLLSKKPRLQTSYSQLTGIERLLQDGLLAFLLKIRAMLPQYPPQVVKFNQVNFYAQVLGAKQGYETVGSVCFKCLLPCFADRQATQHFTILDNCSGYLMPGSLTLVCGPPGCGKSSLHKALAGRLIIDKTTNLTGTVTYNGKSVDQIQVRRIAAFIAQTDRHLPTLTVRETCEFANSCTSQFGKGEQIGGQAVQMEIELGGANLPLELTLHLLGLRGVADTVVGNASIRGVSGGERHRVTTAEMVSGTFLVYLLDEISTGLDSSATYDIVSAFRTFARIRRYTCLFSLLQPSPEVFDLFDRIIVLNEGCIIFQGPREDVLHYFDKLGYVKPKHVDVADFLQEVTTAEGVQFLKPDHKHFTVEEFVRAYMASDMYKDVLRIVNNQEDTEELWIEAAKPLGLKIKDRIGMAGQKGTVVVDEVESTGTATLIDIQQTTQVKAGDQITAIGSSGELEYLALPDSNYDAASIVAKVQEAPGQVRLQLERPRQQVPPENAKIFDEEFVQDWWVSTKTVLCRQATLALRNTSFVYARNLQLVLLGVFTGTLFYQVPNTTDRSTMDLRKSLAFLAVMTLSLNTVSQIPIQLDERSVFEKQYAARFFRPNAYVLACTLSQIPFSFMEMLIYTPLIYWLTGLTSSNNGAHYIMYILVVFIEAITFAMLIRLLASFCKTKEAASGLAGLAIIFFLLFSGFLIARNKVPDWWIWVYYISPLQWGVTALICNEFLSQKYSQVKLPPAARLLRNPESQPRPNSKSSPPKIRFPKFGRAKNSSAAVAPSIAFEPMIMSFHQITYEVKIPGIKDPRVLLSNVSGFAKPNTMTALMGSSGAGKTTLLDVLAGRKTTGRISGDILINGYPKVQETFARISGYVEQNDIHTPFITVKESLEFSSALRLPKQTSSASRQKYINEVMNLLELHDISNKLVGIIGDAGLSVEEAKRLTIGVELVSNPSILFLDEPTSGLDSRAAQIVMRGVVNIVGSGRSVICTIHQPSRRLFMYFDHLMLLKRGGEVAYFGPIGERANELLNYFQSLPGVRECSVNQNPASYMLEIIGAGIGHTAQRDFGIDYLTSSLAQRNFEELEVLRYGKGKLGKEPIVRGYGARWSLMCIVVVKRQFRTYWRNISYSFGRMMLVVILGLILGSTFWQVNAERVVYYRERASNMYPVFFYSLSWTLAEIPYLCVSTLLFCSVCFTMGGVATNSGRNFFEFWFIFFEYSASITFFGIFLAMLTPNAQVATIIVPIIVNFWNMTSGFMIPKSKIPQFWIWLYWVNPTQYTINSLTAIAFHCDVEVPPCNACVELNPASCPDCNCVRVTDEGNLLAWFIVRDSMSLDYSSRYRNMGMLAFFNVLFMFAGVIALRFMKYDRR